ncbi:thiamine biosynthesis protein ThiJ [Paenibacillus sp. FSL R7-0273]|uniref:DJ-1/PfpI family protein n=1 Tax=Paenibacillus sp. FSL R7-0273 TaxID=1536772 RepID=UPI0004F6B995|nr:DJ-1/PfpI family protein [Paenibacillus sp. FSL R7-0273]AIQ46707.1 thiamine biosynthesis protein ThiJ [Paenibacillus sp. FSL R7-0273]OMF97524.1 thiamine biosynthesis protein ThiJ [Paenibacillus sp. FSL R7-0273]
MKMAFILFDGVTFLDFAGFYDVIYRLGQFDAGQGLEWDICGLREEITDELGLTVKINRIKPDLSEYDLIFVPGGLGTRKLRSDADFINWLQGAAGVPYKISVCTGSLLLGAAGFLENRSATTHPSAYELLAPYCSNVVKARIVQDGSVVTGGGVSASIDLGLYMLSMLAGDEAMLTVKQQIDYPYVTQGIVQRQ